MLASAFGFAAMGMCVRLADDFGEALSSFQKSFFRNLVAFSVALPVFIATARRQGFSVPRAGWMPLVLRSVFGTAGIFMNFYALSHIHLSDACMLNKFAPFATLLASWAFMGERLRARQALAVAVAFLGAMLVVKPGFAFGGSSYAAALGLASGVAAGLAYACVHRLGVLGMTPSFIVLFFSTFSTLAALPSLFFGYQPMTPLQVLILLGAGVGATVGQFGITMAYRFAQPREIVVYDYSNVAFAALFGFLVFGQIPDVFSVLGILLIVAMGVFMRRAR